MNLKWSDRFLLCTAFLTCLPMLCGGTKYIMFCPAGSQSHLNTFYTIGSALAEKGHDVTIVTSHLPKNIPKIKEIFLENLHKSFTGNTDKITGFVNAALNPSSRGLMFLGLIPMFSDLCPDMLDDPAMHKIITTGRQYDVAINNYFFTDCTLPVASKVAKYVVFAGSTALMNNMAYENNIPFPISYIPSMALTNVSPMTFMQRAENAAFGLVWFLGMKMIATPTVDRIVQARYPELPTVDEVKKNISFFLQSHHSATDGAHPSVPYVQEIGGIHLRPAKQIPKEFDDFIKKGGNSGFIFVAFGSVVPEELLPEEKTKVFIEVFSKLPYQIIWKYKLPRSDLPPNVLTTKWAPQMDILGDKRCLAFITHGGHASLDESLYNGVPLVGMPVFGDQPLNVAKGVAKGYMIDQQWSDLSVESLLRKVNEVIKNPTYKESAVKQSKLMKDQPQTPLERAVYWLEYVVRHDGAKHLRTAADHLNFFQYFLLDVIAAAVLVLTLVIYIIYKLIKLIVRLACCRSNSGQQKGKKKVKKN